jgi:hypothetical protein
MPNKNQILVHSPAGIRKKANALLEALVAGQISVEQANTARDLLKIASDALLMQEKRNKKRIPGGELPE